MNIFSRPQKKTSLKTVFEHFRKILSINNKVLGQIAAMEQALGGEFIFDRAFLQSSVADLTALVRQDIYHLNGMTNGHYVFLFDRFEEIQERLAKLLEGRPEMEAEQFVIGYRDLNRDMDEFVGAKNANLAETGNMLAVTIPTGFALTTRAYTFYLEANGIPRKIAAMAGLSPEEQAESIAALFVPENMPPALREAIEEQVSRIQSSPGQLFAVRSSAVGEDGDRSFAGQFVSYLNISASGVAAHCLKVMASRFSVQILRGFAADALCWEFPMAVGVQAMVPAAVGGVVYTRDPSGEDDDIMLISAVAGNSSRLVSGEEGGDQYVVSRRSPFPLLQTILEEPGERGVREDPLRLEDNGLHRGSSLLTGAELKKLAEAALLIEKHFGRPQDIEWVIDQQGRHVIVQCRRLYMAEALSVDLDSIRQELAAAEVILRDCGHPAQLGVATGQVVHVDSRNPQVDFPVGAIGVARTADPMLSGVIQRAAALLTEVGSPTGHLASIAREYRTPALFGCGTLLERLAEGCSVTVDVEERTIYAGHLASLDKLQYLQNNVFSDTSEMRVLRRLLRLITPLNLNEVSGFREDQCRSLHDIIRFCHEKAVETLIRFHSGDVRRGENPVLVLPLPLKIRMVDLGGGLAPGVKKELDPFDIASKPLQALLQGMLLRGIWENEPVSIGIRDILSSALRTPQLGSGTDTYVGENLAIVAEDYVNLSLRLGYHFNVIDSFISDDPANNYIYFRFVGGMADSVRRARRAELISIILHSLHFRTERHGDVVVGKTKMITVDQAASTLGRLGQLIAFTRQLDVRMVGDDTIDTFMEKFLDYTRKAWESA